MDWLTIFLAFIASSGFWGFITFLVQKRMSRNDEIARSRSIELAISRELLDIQLSARIREGFCSVEQLRHLNDFYTIYKSLGGNSYIEELMEEVEKLPKQKN